MSYPTGTFLPHAEKTHSLSAKDNFGGFSKEFRYKTTWGSKDWDIIDEAVKGGLEIKRKRSSWIYRYYHSKKGKWQNENVNKTALAKRNSKTGLVAEKHPSVVKNKR